MKPALLVIAGPNGAGKTTLTIRLRQPVACSERGYFSRVFFVGTSDPRINAARVAGRVMQGGHASDRKS
ncbi:MAG: hypothetical protein ABW061_01240 [Polyangiaceae bacterium]